MPEAPTDTDYVTAADGVKLFVETWRPQPQNGRKPPGRLPTLLEASPYSPRPKPPYLEELVSRGYAVTRHHVRGFGRSGGCAAWTGGTVADDISRVIEYVGAKAPWARGQVGMYGLSYAAEVQLAVAGLGDRERTRYLKAIVPVAGLGGVYDYLHLDGVPYTGLGAFDTLSYFGQSVGASPFDARWRERPDRNFDPARLPERPGCKSEHLIASTDHSGDYTDYLERYELSGGAVGFRAATLWVQGLQDPIVRPVSMAGFYDRLPAGIPHKAVLGAWRHGFPDNNAAHPEWSRADWVQMMVAWFDRYVNGLETGVEHWPAVQVQGSDGQWRTERDWPSTGGSVGQLALSAGGALGSFAPHGSTAYSERVPPVAEDGRAVFTTTPLGGRLEITAQPVLDGWIKLDRPDAHLAAQLEVLDEHGQPVEHHDTFGLRSARHLDAIETRFRQRKGRDAPVGEPFRVRLRFQPTDLVVPAGGQLRLTLTSTIDANEWPSHPSGAGAAVTILHDCDRPTALRFRLPDPESALLNVREFDDEGDLADEPAAVSPSDADGLATEPVCGRRPDAP